MSAGRLAETYFFFLSIKEHNSRTIVAKSKIKNPIKNRTKEVKMSNNELGLVHFTINVMQICKNGERIVLTGILKR